MVTKELTKPNFIASTWTLSAVLRAYSKWGFINWQNVEDESNG